MTLLAQKIYGLFKLFIMIFALWSSNSFGLDILTIGDSITQGLQRTANNVIFGIPNPVNGAADIGGYQSRVNDKLNAINMPSTLYNWGVGGENSSQGVGRISSVLNTKPNADFILIMYGANDLYQGISASANKANLRSMIDQSRARGIEPIIGEITPNNFFGVTIPAVYNPNIIALAGETKTSLAHMHTLLFPGWNSVPYNSGDGLHLSDAGYERMADIWFDILVSKSQQPTPTPQPVPVPGLPNSIAPILELLLLSD